MREQGASAGYNYFVVEDVQKWVLWPLLAASAIGLGAAFAFDDYMQEPSAESFPSEWGDFALTATITSVLLILASAGLKYHFRELGNAHVGEPPTRGVREFFLLFFPYIRRHGPGEHD